MNSVVFPDAHFLLSILKSHRVFHNFQSHQTHDKKMPIFILEKKLSEKIKFYEYFHVNKMLNTQ